MKKKAVSILLSALLTVVPMEEAKSIFGIWSRIKEKERNEKLELENESLYKVLELGGIVSGGILILILSGFGLTIYRLVSKLNELTTGSLVTLQGRITGLEGTAAAKDELTALRNDFTGLQTLVNGVNVATLQDAFNALRTEVTDAIPARLSGLATATDLTALQGRVDGLERTADGAATKDELTNLKNDFAEVQTAVGGISVTGLQTRVNQIEGRLAALKPPEVPSES
ncbi:MAG: hypothetical protein LBL71_02285 [Endomicrobium sp.]|nr:hypothetical protein [Endomicrobium sp.]